MGDNHTSDIEQRSTQDSILVDPARLATGSWCHRTDRQIGEGDIAASYSADRIGMD